MTALTPKSLFRLGQMVSRTWLPPLASSLRDWSERIRRELRIVERARSEGRDNRPLTSDEQPDATQQSVFARFDAGARDLGQALGNQTAGAVQLIEERRTAPIDADAAAQSAEIAVARICDAHRDTLVAARLEEREAWSDLQKFRRDNGLARSARYPATKSLPLALLGAVLFAETAVNAVLFMRASRYGWVGGMSQAFLFSLGNVALGFFLLGLGALRHAGHVVPWKRYVGLAAGALLALIGLGWNLLVAHYREALAADPQAKFLTEVPQLTQRMFAAPFSFDTADAIVLLAIGLFVLILAVVDGWLLIDDPYPGFGAIDRAYRRTQRGYEAAVAAFKRDATKALGAVVAKVEGALAQADRYEAEARDIAAQAAQREREVRDSAAALIRECLTSLRIYREENCAIRTTPPPAYFAHYPTFPIDLPPRPEVPAALAATSAALGETRQTALAARKRLADVEAMLIGAFRNFVESEVAGEAGKRMAEAAGDRRRNEGTATPAAAELVPMEEVR